MIRDIASLLENFFEYERSKVATFNMPHMPTLGDAYEQITQQGLNNKYILPELHGLKVVTGFIKIGDDLINNQIDCMLVYGEGERYALTDNYFYDIDKVLAIFEVKKNLQKSSLIDAISHLSEIKIKLYDYFDKIIESNDFEKYFKIFSLHYAYLTGFRLERIEDLKKLSQDDAKIAHFLLVEMIMPVTIVHGHEGYNTISGLRNALKSIIEDVNACNSGRGFRPQDFPTLITTSDGGILKTTALPYWCNIYEGESNSWAYMCSFTENPALIIIEKLWAKIGIVLDISFPYGDDQEKENLFPFLNISKIQGVWQSIFIDYSNSNFKKLKESNFNFSPIEIPEIYSSYINFIFFKGGVDVDEYKEYLNQQGINTDDFFDKLQLIPSFGITKKSVNIIDGFICAKVEDKVYISSEIDRFRVWLTNYENHEILFNNIFAI
ncbi:DUF6602 domain-containing protein [Acinetobacter sp. ANC 4636]